MGTRPQASGTLALTVLELLSTQTPLATQSLTQSHAPPHQWPPFHTQIPAEDVQSKGLEDGIKEGWQRATPRQRTGRPLLCPTKAIPLLLAVKDTSTLPRLAHRERAWEPEETDPFYFLFIFDPTRPHNNVCTQISYWVSLSAVRNCKLLATPSSLNKK